MADRLGPSFFSKKESLVAASFVIMLLQIQVVLGIPRFIKEPPPLQFILKGQSAKLPWKFDDDGKKIIFAVWKKHDSRIRCVTRFRSPRHMLSKDPSCRDFLFERPSMVTLRDVSKRMEGKYRCELNFEDGTSIRSLATITVVNKAPTFTASPAINVVTEGDSFVTLTVEVAGEYDVSVTWYKDGTLVNGSKYHTESRKLGSTAGFDRSVQSNLTIASPRRSLSDDVFLAQAAYGSHSPISMSNILLIVWYGPENIRLSSDVSKGGVILGQSVEISCTASSNPPPKFTIIQNGLTVLANSRHGILTISRFERNSSGYYSCIAKNEVGSLTVHGLKLINLERINIASCNEPWWVWLIVGLTISLAIVITVGSFFMIKRYKSKQEGANDAPLGSSTKSLPTHTNLENAKLSHGHKEKTVQFLEANKQEVSKKSLETPLPDTAKRRSSQLKKASPRSQRI